MMRIAPVIISFCGGFVAKRRGLNHFPPSYAKLAMKSEWVDH